jgi:hypothetical protein
VLQLGLLCRHPNPDARPILREVHRYMVDREVGQLVASLPPSKPRVQNYIGAMDNIQHSERVVNTSHLNSTGAHSLQLQESSSGLTWSSSGPAKFLIA